MSIDPVRIALIRYLASCIRAEQRARRLLEARQARTAEAKQQIREHDQDMADERRRRAA